MQLVGIIIVVKEHAVLPPAKTLLYFIADPVLLIAIKVVVPLRYLEGIINYLSTHYPFGTTVPPSTPNSK